MTLGWLKGWRATLIVPAIALTLITACSQSDTTALDTESGVTADDDADDGDTSDPIEEELENNTGDDAVATETETETESSVEPAETPTADSSTAETPGNQTSTTTVTADEEPNPAGSTDTTLTTLAVDEQSSENTATPPPIDDDADDGDNGSAGGTVSALDPGSAVACAVFEIGRDAAIDGDPTRAVTLAAQVDATSIVDSEVKTALVELAAADAADIAMLNTALDRCQTLGYESAS